MFIFCPPGPEPLRKRSVRSASGIFVRGRFVGFMVERWDEVRAEEREEVGLMVNAEVTGKLAFEVDFE